MTVILKRSNNSKHKFMAVFPDGKIVRFGAKGYSDYTIHKDRERMKRYIVRHRRGGENWTRSGSKTAGFWSRWLLWSEPNFQQALRKTERVIGQKIIYK
jgi:hypothetical protein